MIEDFCPACKGKGWIEVEVEDDEIEA